jgi:hypothetical protein
MLYIDTFILVDLPFIERSNKNVFSALSIISYLSVLFPDYRIIHPIILLNAFGTQFKCHFYILVILLVFLSFNIYSSLPKGCPPKPCRSSALDLYELLRIHNHLLFLHHFFLDLSLFFKPSLLLQYFSLQLEALDYHRSYLIR